MNIGVNSASESQVQQTAASHGKSGAPESHYQTANVASQPPDEFITNVLEDNGVATHMGDEFFSLGAGEHGSASAAEGSHESSSGMGEDFFSLGGEGHEGGHGEGGNKNTLLKWGAGLLAVGGAIALLTKGKLKLPQRAPSATPVA